MYKQIQQITGVSSALGRKMQAGVRVGGVIMGTFNSKLSYFLTFSADKGEWGKAYLSLSQNQGSPHLTYVLTEM